MGKIIGVAVLFGIAAAMLLQYAEAQTVHVVGDSLGWTVPQNGAAAYESWATSKTFAVGDILQFNFVTGEHDVLRLPKDSFDSCSTANPIGDTVTTGPVNITLSNAGDHYYICTIGRHCQSGQKLAIAVSGSPGAVPPTSSTPPSTQTPTTPSPTSGTPDACAPTPASSPAAPPKGDGPVGPTPPNSSSSGVFASFMISLLSVVAVFLF